MTQFLGNKILALINQEDGEFEDDVENNSTMEAQ